MKYDIIPTVDCAMCGESVAFLMWIAEDYIAGFEDIAFFCSDDCVQEWEAEGG